jgi:hypothetical protein
MKYLFCLLMPFVSSCYSQKKIESEKAIQNTWCLVKRPEGPEINYGRIILNNESIIELRSRADTVYSYKYRIEKGYLTIIKDTNDIIKNRILKLTEDTLILGSLLEKQTTQIYYRCK